MKKNSMVPQRGNSDVTVMATTIFRPWCMVNLIDSVRQFDSDCEILIVDDSEVPYAPGIAEGMTGVRAVTCDFDTGLGAKRNIGIEETRTRYVLVCDDDTVFKHLDIGSLKREIEGAHFLCAGNAPSKKRIDCDAGAVYPEPAYTLPDGRPVFHAVENVLFGLRDAFLMNRWADECKVGEHAPYAYSIACKGLGFTPSRGIVYSNARQPPGDKRYGNMRGRSAAMRKKWFRENTDWEDFDMFPKNGVVAVPKAK